MRRIPSTTPNPTPAVGVSKLLIDLLDNDDGQAEVRFGAASAVIEGAGGLSIPAAMSSEPCVACGALGPIRKLSHVAFESAKKGKSAPLLKPEAERAAAEYDDATFAAFHLTELFRGAIGARRLGAFLRALGLIEDGELVEEHYAWPRLRGPHPAATPLGRPALLVATGKRLVGLVALPMRRHPHVPLRLPVPRIDACRSMVDAAASALERPAQLCVIVPEEFGARSLPNASVLSWTDVVRTLVAIDPVGSRLHASADRWSRAIAGQTLPGPLDPWNEVLEKKSAHADYGFHVFPYRSQFTLNSKFKVSACSACGFTSSDGDVRRERQRENPSLLDLIAEVVEDRGLAAEWLDALGCGVGTVERVMCWPRLEPEGTSPDAVFVGSEGVLVVEAKGVRESSLEKDPTAREVLERAATAHHLRHVHKRGRHAKVLVVAASSGTEEVVRRLAESAWSHLRGGAVYKWSKASKELPSSHVLYEEGHVASAALSDGGERGLHGMLAIRSFAAVADALRHAAARRAEECASTDPQAATAYRAMARRADGFMAYRQP